MRLTINVDFLVIFSDEMFSKFEYCVFIRPVFVGK